MSMTPHDNWHAVPARTDSRLKVQTVYYTNPIDPTFGQLLRHYRERAGLSQVQLARRAGYMTHSHISRLESASRLPSMNALTSVIRALDLDADDAARLMDTAGIIAEIREALALLPDELRGRLVA